MATEKDRAFVKFIFDATEEGTIKWEPTAEPDQFTASFKSKYKVFVDKFKPRDTFDYYALKLTDDAEQEMLVVTSHEDSVVEQLFHLAVRRSLNVDAAIDEIMGSKPDSWQRDRSESTSSEPSKPLSDEDIPF